MPPANPSRSHRSHGMVTELRSMTVFKEPPHRVRLRPMRLISLCLAALLLATSLTAQSVKEKPLPLNGTWNESGTVLSLDWQDAKPLRVGPVDINRRPLGATGGRSWEPLVENLQRRFFYEDAAMQPGVAYEYQVIRKARDIVDVGYWLAGWQVPTTPDRGVALLVI